MPVYPDAREVEPAVTDWAIAAWSIAAEPPDVYAFYLSELPRAGFVIDGAMPGGDAAAIRFSSAGGDSYQLDLVGHAPVLITLGAPHQ